MTNLQSLPRLDKFETSYAGSCSNFFPVPLKIGEQPRAHNDDESADLRQWKHKIRKDVKSRLSRDWSVVPNQKRTVNGDECHLYMVFRLLDEAVPRRDGWHNRYRQIDVDNLLKAALDAIKDKKDSNESPLGLIADDAFIRGIKVYKEPVYTIGDEGLLFQCITTKTFTIEKVEIIDGNKLRSHWTSPMQCITAVDEQGVKGKFIDNLTGRIFIARTDKEDEQYHDAVPGYNWDALRKLEPAQKATGCMVFKRTHLDRDGVSTPITLHWLQKWAWW